MSLLAYVVEPHKSDVSVLPEEARQVPVTAHRHDGDTLGMEIPATATRERLEGAPIARALDEHYSAQLRAGDAGAVISLRSARCFVSEAAAQRPAAGRAVIVRASIRSSRCSRANRQRQCRRCRDRCSPALFARSRSPHAPDPASSGIVSPLRATSTQAGQPTSSWRTRQAARDPRDYELTSARSSLRLRPA